MEVGSSLIADNGYFVAHGHLHIRNLRMGALLPYLGDDSLHVGGWMAEGLMRGNAIQVCLSHTEQAFSMRHVVPSSMIPLASTDRLAQLCEGAGTQNHAFMLKIEPSVQDACAVAHDLKRRVPPNPLFEPCAHEWCWIFARMRNLCWAA